MKEAKTQKLVDVLKDFEIGKYPVEIGEGKKAIITIYSDNDGDMSDLEFSKASTILAFEDEEDKVSDNFKHLLKKIDI